MRTWLIDSPGISRCRTLLLAALLAGTEVVSGNAEILPYSPLALNTGETAQTDTVPETELAEVQVTDRKEAKPTLREGSAESGYRSSRATVGLCLDGRLLQHLEISSRSHFRLYRYRLFLQKRHGRSNIIGRKHHCVPCAFHAASRNTGAIQHLNDVVFFRYNPGKTLSKLTALGIPGIVSQPLKQGNDDAESFRTNTKKMMRLYGKVMGGPARRKAEEWCAYFDEKTRYVTGRTSKIPENRRPKVYYLREPDALMTQGRNSNTLCYGEMAGANMFVKKLGLEGRAPVSMEDIMRWNPEFIFVGRQYSHP